MLTGVTDQLVAELLELEKKRQHLRLNRRESRRRRELIGGLVDRMKHDAADDRRKHLRIPAELEVQFDLGHTTMCCTASDLSVGGVTLQSHLWTVLEERELLVNALLVQGIEYRVSIRSKMAWNISKEDQRAGLQFIELDDSAMRQIEAVFEHLLLNYLEHQTHRATVA